jgi:hypothetical protein
MLTRSIVVIRKAAFVRDSQGTHVEAASLTASVRDSYGGRVGAASLTAKSRSRHCAEPVEQVGASRHRAPFSRSRAASLCRPAAGR